MNYSRLMGILLVCTPAIYGFDFTALFGMILPYIVPAYTVKRAFDKNSESSDNGTAVINKECVTKDSGRTFNSCTFNGALHMDGEGNTHTNAAGADPAIIAVHEAFAAQKNLVSRCATACSLQVQKSASWFKNHPIKAIVLGITSVYIYSLARVFYLQRGIRSDYGWGSWHSECQWDLLSLQEQKVLREELLLAVRQRYPLVNDLVPVHSFMNDVESEIAFYTNYLLFIERVKKVDTVRQIITNRFKDAYAGFLGNTDSARMRATEVFEQCALSRWLRVDDEAYILCMKKREHLQHLKAFYAEWLTSVRAVYKQGDICIKK